MNRHFPKKTYKWTTVCKKMLSITIREMHIKITIKYFLTLLRMAVIKKTTDRKSYVETKGSLHTAGRNVNWCSPCGKEHRG